MFQGDASFVDHFCNLCFMIVMLSYLFLEALSLVTCWKNADFLALLYVIFSCVFVTFPYDVLGHQWFLIVSIPDLCIHYFLTTKEARARFVSSTPLMP